ncbi:MAG: DUF4908 domain-containing protein [Alphaproteobacteria bacterium]|nr:DUF4908 domain-containing protein [Alphaproteobacteria bacterium]
MSLLIAALVRFSAAIDRNEPRVGHYVSEDTGIGFVLDRSSELAKLKFDSSEEIFALRWQLAAGGDRLLVRDDGAQMLRIAYLGGVTLFTPGNLRGIPMALDRPAAPLITVPPSVEQVREVAGQIMSRLRTEVGREIVFEADWGRAVMDRGGRAILYDAVRNAGTALYNVAGTPAGRLNLARRLQRVRFVQGGRAGVYLNGPMLVITFSVEQGLAGRPSSFAIGRVVAPFMR